VKLLKQTRINIGHKILVHRAKKLKRTKKACNFQDAQNVGIIFTIEHEQDYEEKRELLNYLKNLPLQMTLVVFSRNPELDGNLSEKKRINIIGLEDLNWYFLPKGPVVEDFIHQPYDMLINLNMKTDLQTSYLTGLSKAHFKIGLKNEAGKFCDLIIDLQDNNQFEYYAAQLKHYLTVINQKV